MGHSAQCIYFISNVFEESVKFRRDITTDSPAANRKVIALCRAARRVGGDAEIISLGRGRVRGSWKSYPVEATQADIVPITYLHYLDVPVITHIVTMISLLIVVVRQSSKESSFVFYNFSPHYLLALFFCRLSGRRCILDIEDGYRSDDRSLRSLPSLWLMKVHNVCCRDGVMLANSLLAGQTEGQNSYICYGVADSETIFRDWSTGPLRVHFGGSLFEDTGAAIFLDALDLLRHGSPEVFDRLQFTVTGFGPCADAIERAASGRMNSFLRFCGNVTPAEYRDILQHSHIGLCLKLPSSSMGATTFPSKVIELVSSGLLLVSTRVSDVPLLFDDTTAFLLNAATPQALAEILLDISKRTGKAHDIALNGQQEIATLLSEQKIGAELMQFWKGISGNQHV